MPDGRAEPMHKGVSPREYLSFRNAGWLAGSCGWQMCIHTLVTCLECKYIHSYHLLDIYYDSLVCDRIPTTNKLPHLLFHFIPGTLIILLSPLSLSEPSERIFGKENPQRRI